MSDKKHYFEVVMNSYSDGVLNQEVAIREYAATGAELTVKQMAVTKKVIPVLVAAFDEMSMPYQEAGLAEMAEAFEAEKPGKAKVKR